MRRRSALPGWTGVLAAALLLAAPRPASAKLLELTLKVHGGGMWGIQVSNDLDPGVAINPDLADAVAADFFNERQGAAFGGVLGVEVLFVDVLYEFYQFADGDGLSSTLNNFLVGFDWDFKAGESWLITPYLVAGFGLATQNNSWLKEKYQISLEDLESRLAQVRIGVRIERMLGRFFLLGADVGFGYHYGIQSATGQASNDIETHYHGFHLLANMYIAFNWDVFRKKKPEMEDDDSETPAPPPPGAAPLPASDPPPPAEPAPPAAGAGAVSAPPPSEPPPSEPTPGEQPPPKAPRTDPPPDEGSGPSDPAPAPAD